ncbi:type II toxin-antitoxin system HicA family toxin [archaeon SCG-AAA382B04]|nr:type II toxin-antitoxin system HicA family toxin [archaeon SCG-AAA382B04]
MNKRDFSGKDIIKVLVNKGNFRIERISGDHYILKWEHPTEDEKRTFVVPNHKKIRIGTLSSIAEQAGAKNFDRFCKWIDLNR